MFSVDQLKQYLEYARSKLADAIYEDQRRFYNKAIAQTEADIAAKEQQSLKLAKGN